MDKTICAKTMLKVFRYTERIIKSLGEQINKRALSSAYYSPRNDTLSVTKDISNLLDRKIKISNLYIAVKKTLSEIKSENSAILIRFFFDGLSHEQLAQQYNFSNRTAYRKVQIALDEFYEYLCKFFINHYGIMKIIYSENWIYNTYKALKSDYEKLDPRLTYKKINNKKQNINKIKINGINKINCVGEKLDLAL